MYQNYIFDFYGTLVDIETDEESKDVWKKISYYMGYQGGFYDPEVIQESYKKYIKKYEGRIKGTEYPDFDIVDVFYKLYKDGGIKVSPQIARQTARAFRAITTNSVGVYESVIETLEKLKEQKKTLYLISNAQRAFIRPELKMLDLKKYFDKVYISSDMQMRKPEPKILEMVMEENKMKKKETIFIGNDYGIDIKMANKIGIDSLYIQTLTSDLTVKKEKCKFEIMDGNHKKMLELLK